MSGFVRTCVSGDGSLVNDPLGGLTGHLCDPVEVGVVVQYDEVVHLGGRGDQEIGDRQAVPALPGKESLDFKRAVRDLRVDQDLGELEALSRDLLVFSRIACAVENLEIDDRAGRHKAQGDSWL